MKKYVAIFLLITSQTFAAPRQDALSQATDICKSNAQGWTQYGGSLDAGAYRRYTFSDAWRDCEMVLQRFADREAREASGRAIAAERRYRADHAKEMQLVTAVAHGLIK